MYNEALFFLITLFIFILVIVIVFIIPYCNVPSTKNIEKDDFSDAEISLGVVTNRDLYGDMGNNIFQIACLIGTKGKVVLPTKITLLPIYNLFDLSKFELKDYNFDKLNKTPIYSHDFTNLEKSENFKEHYEFENYAKINIEKNINIINNIRGYRQCYKYFDHDKLEIQKIFTPNKYMLELVKEKLPKKYIAIHIRRGDYIKFIHNFDILKEFKRCEYIYFQNAIQLLQKEYLFLKDVPILVCTDSPKLVDISFFGPNAQLAPMVENVSGKFSDFITLYLSNAIVISNSTYSWWAAYLKDKPTVCPSPWWDPRGFPGKALGLDGPYLHYPSWWLLDPETGDLIREPNSKKGEKEDISDNVPKFFKYLRGMFV